MPLPCAKWPNSWASTPVNSWSESPSTSGRPIVSTRSLPRKLARPRRNEADAFTSVSTSMRRGTGAPTRPQSRSTNLNTSGSVAGSSGIAAERPRRGANSGFTMNNRPMPPTTSGAQ